MASQARPTPATFVAQLPPDRQREVKRVRAVIRRNLPTGYEEVVSRNMLVYQIPLARYPDTYNGHPMWYVALASEKSYLSLHMMGVYGNQAQLERLRSGFAAAGKRLDMGKACVRFKSADDLALDVIGELVAGVPMERMIEVARSARAKTRAARAATPRMNEV